MIPDEIVIRGFQDSFGGAPAAIAAVPGRINLVGDHIDYLQLPVLPLAVPRGVSVAVRARDDGRVRLANADRTYAPAEFAVQPPIPPEPGSWSDYARAAVSAVGGARGFDAFVASDLPAAAGLSSSSALVVAMALAALHASGWPLEPLALAARLARGERYVGTEGGGMDQAVVLCAEAGAALRIDFAPLRVRPLRIPDDWRFLVASSLRAARKSGELRAAYNERSRSARAALAERAPGLEGDALLSWIRANRDAAGDAPARLRHVISEALRVEAATSALERGDAAAFGRCMSASHASLRDDYQVSTPELDEIVEIAVAAGARGARLTGAGFGGSAIALCSAETEPVVRRALAAQFYAPREREPILFTAVPSAGARLAAL